MSDDRQSAEQDLANAMEDSLGVSKITLSISRRAHKQSSLSSSFAPPRTEPKLAPAPQPAQETPAVTEAEAEESKPVPGMDEWKDTYESYLQKWQHESAIARERAEKTRKRIEDEHAAAAKAKKDEEEAKKKAEAAKKAEEARQERLKRELEEIKGSKSRRKGRQASGSGTEEREQKVKEAWEMVKAAGSGIEPKQVVTDARGTMDADIKAGQVHIPGEPKKAVKVVSVSFLLPSDINNSVCY